MIRGRVVYVIGVSGCGKSTVAEALAQRIGGVFLEGDEFQPPENVAAMSAGIPLTDQMRWGWMADLTAAAVIAAKEGQDVVVACSGLKRSYRDYLREKTGTCRMLFLNGTDETIRTRMAARKNHYMPSSLLDSQFAALEAPAPDEKDVGHLDIEEPAIAVIARAAAMAFPDH